MRIQRKGVHLSGAEDLVPDQDLGKKMQEYSLKLLPFLGHPPSAPPAQLTITVDPVPPQSILEGTLLPVQAMESGSEEETREGLQSLISEIVPKSTASRILELFHSEILSKTVRNGALLVASSGNLLKENLSDGIRTTHVGCINEIREYMDRECSAILQRPNHRFLDALILASKVVSSENILLELCVSDDPLYSTGYLATQMFGYVRIPHMKPKGHDKGGRLYVLKENAHLPHLLTFLRTTPVLFTKLSPQMAHQTHKILKFVPLGQYYSVTKII